MTSQSFVFASVTAAPRLQTRAQHQRARRRRAHGQDAGASGQDGPAERRAVGQDCGQESARTLLVVRWGQLQQLSSDCTDYLCAALLEWSMLGELWPDPAEPIAGPDCDHLEALVQITERLVRHAVVAQPISRRFELARVGRELGTAIRCQRDPQALAESRWRELVHRQPWLASPPAPVVLPDGRAL